MRCRGREEGASRLSNTDTTIGGSSVFKGLAIPRAPIFVRGYYTTVMGAAFTSSPPDQARIGPDTGWYGIVAFLYVFPLILVVALALMSPHPASAGWFILVLYGFVAFIITLFVAIFWPNTVLINRFEGVKLSGRTLHDGPPFGRHVPSERIVAIQLCARHVQGGHTGHASAPDYVMIQINLITVEGGRALIYAHDKAERIVQVAIQIGKTLDVPVLDHR